jgi:serine/threonine protein kinase
MVSDDVLITHLRRGAGEQSGLDEQVWLQLEQLACKIPPEQTIDATVSAQDIDCSVAGPPLPVAFGAYLLLEQLGQGGMGIVYKARQQTLKRPVALKMVRAGIFADAQERARFHREGEAIARVRHANVVQIFEFGESQGQLFFSMELLAGGTLANRLQGQPMPERDAAELVRTLAQAVEAAHRQGVVHRDLKPSNVLFASDGTAKITDFGLAKVLDEDSNETCSDAVLGTATYMAPEQARGDSCKVSPSADVYALGAILYEALTGHPPFRGDTRYRTLELVLAQEPEPPSRHRRGLARDLEAICLKCLEKEPGRRYPSAAALAEDLQRWLDGRVTYARPLRWHNHLLRAIRRHSLPIAAACGVVVLIAILSAFTYLRDPQRKLEDLQSRLRRGESVTPIGESGDPVWSRWDYQKGVSGPSPLQDGAFSISSAVEPTLLTLLLDPQQSYRFSAEVRHEDGDRLSHAGIFFAHSRHAASDGWQNCFCSLIFDDIDALYPHPRTGLKVSRLRFVIWRALEGGASNTGEKILEQAYFTPTLPWVSRQYVWRSLAVEVRPEGIEVLWESQRFHVSRQEVLDLFAASKYSGPNNPSVDRYPELQPAFTPRDALGLIVDHGRASFRRVRVEPLPQP